MLTFLKPHKSKFKLTLSYQELTKYVVNYSENQILNYDVCICSYLLIHVGLLQRRAREDKL